MQTQCVRILLKQGQTERFLSWIRSVQNRQSEMLEAMRAEGVSFEAMFLDRSDQGDSIVFYMRARDLAEAQNAFSRSTLPIDVETRSIIAECWDVASARPLEPCVELTASTS